jgi:hypothetical protein
MLTFPCHEKDGQEDGIRFHGQPLVMADEYVQHLRMKTQTHQYNSGYAEDSVLQNRSVTRQGNN